MVPESAFKSGENVIEEGADLRQKSQWHLSYDSYLQEQVDLNSACRHFRCD